MTKIKNAKTNNSFFGSVKTLSRSIREYKKPSLLAPLFVAMEVVLECLIPWIMSLLLEAMRFLSGDANISSLSPFVKKILFLLSNDGRPQLLSTILFFGAILITCAFLNSIVSMTLNVKFFIL